MKKKQFLTEAKRKEIIADKEKVIIESFAKMFNRIKRIDENEINRIDENDDNNIKKILTDIQLQNPNDRNKNFVIDKLLDDKQYPFQYGGNGKQLGTYNMTWLELSKLAYEVLFRKGVENWGENNWKTMSDFINIKINQNKV